MISQPHTAPSCSPRCQPQPTLAARAPRPRWTAAGRHARRRGQPVASAAAVGELADAASALSSLGPAIGAGVLLAGLAGLRFTAYSQLEYVTAAMLARHVKPGGARVLQLGGTTRDVFYYPEGTVQVTVVGPDLKKGLWEQAGMQAKIPVVPRVQPYADNLLFAPAGSIDSVVLLNTLSAVSDIQEFCSEVFRVLKPGGTFVFVQRVRGGALQPLVLGGPPVVDATTIDMVMEYGRWDYVQCDPALAGTDLHAVGVAVKPLRQQAAPEEDSFSVDKSAFEQLMKAGGRGKAGGGGKGSGSGGAAGFGKK